MKMTLLEMVQDILFDMESDPINSLGDTVESLQVAGIVKSVFYSIVQEVNFAQHRKTLQLTPTTTTTPNYMTLPEGVREIDFINYNKRKITDVKDVWQPVYYMPPDEFLHHTNGRNTNNSNVVVINDLSEIPVLVLNDKSPDFWTSFDDTNICFDSWDNGVESNLQNSKTQCVALITPEWRRENEFIPDLPAEAFPWLLAESKSTAMLRIKQVQDAKAEQVSVKQRRLMSQKNWKAHSKQRFPDYGRPTVAAGRDVTFKRRIKK